MKNKKTSAKMTLGERRLLRPRENKQHPKSTKREKKRETFDGGKKGENKGNERMRGTRMTQENKGGS